METQDFVIEENKEVIDLATSDELTDREDSNSLTYEDKVSLAYYSLMNNYVKGHCWDNEKGRNIDSDGIAKAIYQFTTKSKNHEHAKQDALTLFFNSLKYE